MSDLLALRRLLPRTFHAFFGRFYGSLLPVQQAAIPDILAGHDAVLMSATASGKTEAAAAPLVERMHDRADRSRPAVLYVSPTRALATDLLRRLEEPCRQLGVQIARRTGEHRSAMLRKRLPDIVITTPESLDSLLCRMPSAFGSVTALVLDELHLLLHGGRGDQLAGLCQRVAKVAPERPQTVVLSATLPDLDGVRRRYLRGARVHAGGPPRPIEMTYLEGAACQASLPATLTAALRERDVRKVLAFCDRRDRAEQLANALSGKPPFADAVFVHHSSLDRRTREWAESQLLARTHALCIATSTLEVGIDIGDVDAVWLLDPPASVASFLQRVGRGNRRTDQCKVLVSCESPGSRLWLEHLAACAQAGDLLDDPVPFRPGVLAQQALSLALQNRAGWVSAAALRARLPVDARERYGARDVDAVLLGLSDQKWLTPTRAGRFAVAERLRTAFGRGRVHSVIGQERPSDGVLLIDELTEQPVGAVREAPAGGAVGLGGRAWQVMGETADGSVRVRGASHANAKAAFPITGRMLCSRRLCSSLRAWLGLAEHRLPVLPAADGQGFDVFHFQGTVVSEVLAGATQRMTGKKTVRPRALAFTWRGDDLRRLVLPDVPQLRQATAARAGAIARLVQGSSYGAALPRPLLERFATDVVDIDAIAAAAGQWQPDGDLDEGLSAALAELRGR